MYTESGILWFIMFLLLSPNLIILFSCMLIAVFSALAGYFLFLHRGAEQHKLSVVMRRMCLCSMASQYISLIAGLIFGAMFFSNSLGSEWPLLDSEILANNLYALFIIAVSIFLTYGSSYRWALREAIPNYKARKSFCILCSAISGGSLFSLHLLFDRILW